jgi:hypothetical protein
MAILVEQTDATELVRWRRSQIAETFASVRVSAPSYRFAENIGFVPIVESKLKLIQIQRQIFLADVMVRSDDATLQQRPERFHCVCMRDASYVLASRMINELMLAIVDADGIVSAKLIRDYERCVSLGYLANESSQRVGIGTLNHLANYIPFASNCANDRHLAGRNTTGSRLTVLAMAILVESANERLIHFHDSHQLAELRVFHSGTQPHAHIPSGLIRAGSKQAMDLERAHSLLARDHQVQNLEPNQQRFFGFLKDGSGSKREPIRRARFRTALHTLPVPRTRSAFVNVIVLTTRALRASGPASQQQISATCVLIREQRIELTERQLSHKTRLVLACFRHASDISANARVSQEPDNPLV